MISFIIPSYNNLQHLKNVYASIQKHAPQAEVVLLDDGSTDGTWEWIWNIAEGHQHREVKAFKSETRVGHTILYDKGIELATNEIVGILHADMILGPNYVENMLKHLTPGKVVCATRIEPPLHPPGKEKIVADFGMDFDTLNIEAFERYALDTQKEYSNQTTKGMFAPWILYKKDFEAIGGHDPLFAPFPYEDSDIFQRWLLNGYELVQSRDALVYHLTCRGHRWNDQIGKDGDFYIDVTRMALFGPKEGGVWGKPVFLRPEDWGASQLGKPVGTSGGRTFSAAMGGGGSGTSNKTFTSKSASSLYVFVSIEPTKLYFNTGFISLNCLI